MLVFQEKLLVNTNAEAVSYKPHCKINVTIFVALQVKGIREYEVS